MTSDDRGLGAAEIDEYQVGPDRRDLGEIAVVQRAGMDHINELAVPQHRRDAVAQQADRTDDGDPCRPRSRFFRFADGAPPAKRWTRTPHEPGAIFRPAQPLPPATKPEDCRGYRGERPAARVIICLCRFSLPREARKILGTGSWASADLDQPGDHGRLHPFLIEAASVSRAFWSDAIAGFSASVRPACNVLRGDSCVRTGPHLDAGHDRGRGRRRSGALFRARGADPDNDRVPAHLPAQPARRVAPASPVGADSVGRVGRSSSRWRSSSASAARSGPRSRNSPRKSRSIKRQSRKRSRRSAPRR